MAARSLKPRKRPVQERSTQLVADILKAAIRVLEREGATRLTTIRVAEAAGVSVGSLYQYFPNKEAILFRLQLEEWERTGRAISAILGDPTRPPFERLRAMVGAFIRSECEEAPLRQALDRAAPSFHDAPEAQAERARGKKIGLRFIAEAAPNASPRERAFALELVFLTMTAVGKQVSELRPSAREIDRWADAISSMLEGHLVRLGGAVS